ncbi:riboflavin biosynthesis pyrimidine reductase [Agromyces ramosus]|jgi:riboflavin biosynthesis pyrimidine reductase|uniref:Riboflavin biosynthesis pyrimidine reductase n=1 Tax=Agromyces ramosus TaxID=33879 RepID=A0A4Q7M9X6_9MICO|nr:pyrimidine reductase family protein [Agromyces ramosus]RZS64077.1 riboflavin biosynthesis pyrimidine reductase [Agromyces ramosus]
MTAPVDREELLEAYAIVDRTTPRVRMNFVMSLDGAVTLEGRSGGLGDESDRLAMQVLRSLADVVLVGAGTVRIEGYGGLRVDDADAAWRREQGRPGQPRVAVVSSRLDLSPEHPFFAPATERPLVVTRASAPSDRRAALAEVADVLVCGDDVVDLRAMVGAFAGLGLPQVLCEGGPHLFGSLIDADLVDELCLSLSPLLVAGEAGRIVRGAPEVERRMRLVHAIPAGDLLLLRYARASARRS